MPCVFVLEGRVLPYVQCVNVKRQSPVLCPVCFMLEGMTIPYALWGYVSYLGLDD